MRKTVYVTCPFCTGMMEVSSDSGEIVDKWEAKGNAGPHEDKMSSALKQLEEQKKKRASLFSSKKEALEEQRKNSESVFKKEVERLKKEGVSENPIRPFDLD